MTNNQHQSHQQTNFGRRTRLHANGKTPYPVARGPRLRHLENSEQDGEPVAQKTNGEAIQRHQYQLHEYPHRNVEQQMAERRQHDYSTLHRAMRDELDANL